MNRISPRKLLHTKWTAVHPVRREKHFLVTEVQEDEEGYPVTVTLEAVYSHRERTLKWRALKDSEAWRIGWV